MTRRAFVVTGAHRSGTSAMARLLSLRGARLPERLVEPFTDNPLGYWEPAEMVALDDAMLDAVDSAWDDVFALGAAARARQRHDEFALRAKAFIAKDYGNADLLVLKDPRASLLAPFWHEVLSDLGIEPVHVVMVRNPLAVAESLLQRNRFPLPTSILLWTSSMLAVERGTRTFDRVFVEYDALVDDWRGTLDRIEAELGWGLPRTTDAAAGEIESFLDGRHRHHRASREDLARQTDVWPGARTAYDWFEAAARGERRPTAILDEIAAELTALEGTLGAVVADLRSRLATHDQARATKALALKGQELDTALAFADRLHARADLAEQRAALMSRELEAARELADQRLQEIASAQAKLAIVMRARDRLERTAGSQTPRDAEREAELRELRWANAALQSSLSWRLTAPLRHGLDFVRRVVAATAKKR